MGLIHYVKGLIPYSATGMLVNTSTEEFIPYFLTAHHVIDTSSQAASAEVFWDYVRPCFGAPVPSLSSLPRSISAQLLYTAATADATLLRLESAAIGDNSRWYDLPKLVPPFRVAV